jgi:predicted CXXCH cytochrome family protein
MISRTLKHLAVLFFLLIYSHTLFAGVTAEHYLTLNDDLNQPTDTAISKNGNIYILNGTIGQVVVFTKEGAQNFIFGKPGKNNGELNLPMGISISNNQIYIADTGNQRISVFSLKGEFIRNIHPETNNDIAPVSLLILDNKLIWSDRLNHQVCIHSLENGKKINCWGNQGGADGQFQYPFQIVADEQGYIHVIDTLNARVQIFNPRGKHFMNAGRFGIDPGKLFRPNGLALDSNSNLLVSDAFLGTISIFKNSKALGLLTTSHGKILKLKSPTSLTLWKNRLYITDTLSNSIEVFKLKKTVPKIIRISESNSSQKNCITCHISWAENYSSQQQSNKVPPVAHQDMCYSCHHGVVIDSRTAIGHKEQHPDTHHTRNKNKQDKKNKDKIAKSFPVINRPKPNKGELYCGSCHTPHKLQTEQHETLNNEHNNSWMREKNNSGEICLQCHDSKLDDIQHKTRPTQGINHPVGIYLKQPLDVNSGYAKDSNLHKGLPEKLLSAGASLNNKQQLTCQSCHLVHGADDKELTAITSDNSMLCQACHQRHYAKDLADARKKGVHPVNIKLDKPVKINNIEIKSVTCLTCHSSHKGKKDSALLSIDNNNGELCNTCHQDYKKIIKSDHDLRLTAAKSKNRYNNTPEHSSVCGTCHSMHQSEDNKHSLDATITNIYKGKEKPLPRDQMCLNCHSKDGNANKSQLEFFSHPTKSMILRSDKEKMPLVNKENKIEEFGEIVCITCHNPHRWSAHKSIEDKLLSKTNKQNNDTGNILNSFLHQKDISQSFCKDCHGIETRLKYKYYHLKLSRQ